MSGGKNRILLQGAQNNSSTISSTTAPKSENLRPLFEFAHAGLPNDLKDALQNAGFTRPTPIQAQAWPIALSGRDMIGVAQTGSGKSLAFIVPALVRRLP